MDELVDKDVKTANVNVLHIFEKIDESMSMLRRDVEDTKKGQLIQYLRQKIHWMELTED